MDIIEIKVYFFKKKDVYKEKFIYNDYKIKF